MMIKDADLKSATDYSEGMVDAAYRVLGEIVNILEPYADDMRIVGGWVPSLLFPNNDHVGSIDVDVLFNQNDIGKAESYENIKRILTRNGYAWFDSMREDKRFDVLFERLDKCVICREISTD